MAIRLSDLELERLQGLPHFVRSVYIFGIRPYMDYRTGVVGVMRRVSWQSIAEACYVEPHQGETDSGTPDRSRVRRAAVRLEKAGLVVNQSREKTLIFSCCAADTDKSAENKPDTNPTQTRHSEADTPRANSHAGFPEQADTIPTQGKTPKAGPPPVSGIREEEKDIEIPRARSRFGEFWLAYPKKVGKKPSEEKWKAKQLDRIADQILADIPLRHSRDRKWIDGFIPNPLTYLNQERWNDEIEEAQPLPTKEKRGHQRRSGFQDIDYDAEARAMGFRTEVS